ncbi:MAG: hypothetical protein HYU64_07330 [Armatimonadetes bacterium]|nr:hypothetical protein [Armatimonadota bacterium]
MNLVYEDVLTKLQNAVDGVLDGVLTHEDFDEILDTFRVNVEEDRLRAESEILFESSEAVGIYREHYREGTGKFLEGISEMSEYLRHFKPGDSHGSQCLFLPQEHLTQGLVTASAGLANLKLSRGFAKTAEKRAQKGAR